MLWECVSVSASLLTVCHAQMCMFVCLCMYICMLCMYVYEEGEFLVRVSWSNQQCMHICMHVGLADFNKFFWFKFVYVSPQTRKCILTHCAAVISQVRYCDVPDIHTVPCILCVCVCILTHCAAIFTGSILGCAHVREDVHVYSF